MTGVDVPCSLDSGTRPTIALEGCGNMAQIRESRPDYGLGFQLNVLEPFHVFNFSLGSGGPAFLD